MSDTGPELAHAFIEAQPDAAARVLEQHALEQVAELLQDLPQKLQNQLLPRMLPQYVGRLCRLLPSADSARLLSAIELSFVAAVLRHLNPAERNQVLSRMPASRRAPLSLLLSFTVDTVGAWMTPLVAVVPADYVVQEALNQIRLAGEIIHSDFLFVVDRDRHLRGRINYVDLLRADPGLPIASLINSPCASLLGRMSLLKAADHREWEEFDVMPVNNHQHLFVGVLRHADMRRGLEQMKNTMSGNSGSDPVAGILEVYGDSLIALFESLGDVIESDQRK